MKRSRLISIVLFALIPLTTAIIQVFYYGISFTNIGLAFGIWIVFLTYIVSFVRNNDVIEEEKNNRVFRSMVMLFLMMVFIMSLSIISCVTSIQRICRDKSEKDSLLIAHTVSNQIQNEFEKPITVSKTMSCDYNLMEYLQTCESDGVEATEKLMTSYLKHIEYGFDYQMAFAICDKKKVFYSSDGVVKYIDPDNDREDQWYQKLLDGENDYSLEVKRDANNNQQLALFINQIVCDEDGNFLGVCGVSIGMDQLQEEVLNLEKSYDIKIDLIDENGVIQLDSDSSNIGKLVKDYNTVQISSAQENSTRFYYENLGQQSRMTRYMESLGWYMVVTDHDPIKINSKEISVPSIIIFIGGLCLLALTFSIVALKEQKMRDDLLEKRRISVTDELTGLLNRRAYEKAGQEIKEKNAYKDLVIVMIDVNGLKSINDTLGHKAGDELIISTAKCIHTAFSKYGRIYRIGGDEFVVLLHCSRSALEGAFKNLQYLVTNWKGEEIDEFSVSKGAAFYEEHPDIEFEELQELADQCMYEEKEEYYRRTGKERRT